MLVSIQKQFSNLFDICKTYSIMFITCTFGFFLWINAIFKLRKELCLTSIVAEAPPSVYQFVHVHHFYDIQNDCVKYLSLINMINDQ